MAGELTEALTIRLRLPPDHPILTRYKKGERNKVIRELLDFLYTKEMADKVDKSLEEIKEKLMMMDDLRGKIDNLERLINSGVINQNGNNKPEPKVTDQKLKKVKVDIDAFGDL